MKKESVEIVLAGKTRLLRLDYNAFCALELALPGTNAFDPVFWQDLTPNKVRVLLWAAMLHEDKTITLEAAGDMIELDRFTELVEALAKSYTQAMPKADKQTTDAPPPTENR